MAIGADAAIDFFGTQTEITAATPGAIVNDAFSAEADITSWTNADDAPLAMMTLVVTFGTAPTDGTYIDLYAQPIDVESTGDAPEPATDYLHTYMGSFPVDNVTSEQHLTLEIYLPNYKTSSVYDFAIHNNGTGQSISTDVWELWITTKTRGPHA